MRMDAARSSNDSISISALANCEDESQRTRTSRGNSNDESLIASVETLLDDPAPVVRGAAAWALSRLSPQRFEVERAGRLAEEQDEDVKDEWSFPP